MQVSMATTKSSSEPGRRGFPIWAKIALGLFVFLLVLAVALPYILNVDHYRDSIASAIEEQTGRHVTLGKIRATFLPGVGLVVEDLHIGNPQGFPRGDVVSAQAIRVNLAIGPLLHSTIHLNSLELVSPKVTLVTDDRGKNNYTFTSTTPDHGTPPKAANGGASAKTDEASPGVSLDRIDSLLLTGAEVSLETIVRGKVEPSADVKLDAQFVADLAKASDIKGTLSVPDIEHPQVNFEMSASELDIDKLMAAVGGESIGPSAAPAKAAERPRSGPSELVARGHINVEKITTKPYTVGPANVEIRVYTDRAELWPISIGMYGGTLQISSRVDRAANPPRFTATVQIANLDG